MCSHLSTKGNNVSTINDAEYIHIHKRMALFYFVYIIFWVTFLGSSLMVNFYYCHPGIIYFGWG